MSIIQTVRDKGAWVIGTIIAIALIAFILQDGVGRQGSLTGVGSNIGKVNGVGIDKNEFERKLENASQGNSQQRENLIGQLWNQEVGQILLNQEFDKAGIACTDKQLSEDLFKPTSPLMGEFKDPVTGQPDIEKAKQAFAQFKKTGKEEQKKGVYEGIIEPTKLQAKYAKYTAIINNAAYAPKWLIEKQQADNNAFASVSYVAFPYSTIVDSTIKVTDEQIMAYAKKHKSVYEKDEETRTFKYLSFEVIPSADDSAAIRTKLENKKQELLAENDINLFFAKNTSDLPFYDGYISGKEINQQAKDSLLKLSTGSVYGPYLDGGNYVLAKMVGIKSIPDSAKVRHILVKTMDRDPRTGQEYRLRDDSSAKKLLDSLVSEIKMGKSFDTICLKNSEDEGSKNNGGVYNYFSSGRMVGTFNNFAFTQPVGAKGIVKTQYGYHYVEVLGQKGSSTGYNIAYYAKQITVSNETDALAKNEATKFLSIVQNNKQFDDEAIKLAKVPYPAEGVKPMDYNVPGLGSNRQLVKWIYSNKVGAITELPYNFNTKYVVGIITNINKPGLPTALTLRPLVENLVKSELKAQQILAKAKGTTLEEIAKSYGTNNTVQRIDTLLSSNTFNPILGNDYKFAGAAFNVSQKGKVTSLIAGQNGVFALKTDYIGAKAGVPTDATSLANFLNNNIKSAAGRITNELLKKVATIKDKRAEVY
ncbi:MAG: peptidylprolyl isomerase [Chitinophagaceae bacterium]|nr:peptidylprolyl isomerase [Chitinophagaceae bacterium]